MIYTDRENLEWWTRLSEQDRVELLGTITLKAPDFGKSLTNWYESGRDFSPRQLTAIRKWAKD